MSNETFYQYWGKARQESDGCHLLPYHCMDVAAVSARWWETAAPLRQRIRHTTGLDEEAARAWTLFFVALHDLGKFDIRFQLKASAALAAVWPTFTLDQADPEPGFSHGPAGLYWFNPSLTCPPG